MYIERLVGCLDCGDKFKAHYDSRKDKQDEFICKCGNLKIYVDSFLSMTYNYAPKGNPEKIPYEEQELVKKEYEEDFINPTEEELILFQEIDEIGNMIGYGQYENKSDEYNLDLKLCGCNKYNEGLIIAFEVGLYSNKGWKKEELQKKHDIIKQGLIKFKEIVLKVYRLEIDLDNPSSIYDNSSLDGYWRGSNKTPIDRYDYELYI